MRITGIQKLTLLDFPGHIACTIFTPSCNLCCPFCHNSELVNDNADTEYYPDEVIEFLKTRVGKLDGVAITGGEPLLQKDIADFLKKVKDLGLLVKLDHNGTMPERLKELLDAGLVDYVAMDVKNAPESWAKTTGMSEKAKDTLFEKTKESMEILRNSGIDYEFRTTVVKELHSEEDIENLARFIGPCKNYFLQKFIDSGAVLGNKYQEDSSKTVEGGDPEIKYIEQNYSAHDDETMRKYLSIVQKYIPNAKLRGVD